MNTESTTATEPAAKARHVLAGKTPETMTAAELAAREPDVEQALADKRRELATAERKLKGRSVTAMLSGADGFAKVQALSAELAPLKAHVDALQLTLDGLREARTQAEQREREGLIAGATQAFERELAAADKLAGEIEEHADALIDKLAAYQRKVHGAVSSARSKLSGNARLGFRVSGSSMLNFSNEQLQRTVEIHFHGRSGGFWRCDTVPVTRGGLTVHRLLGNATNELLQTFQVRYSRDQMPDQLRQDADRLGVQMQPGEDIEAFRGRVDQVLAVERDAAERASRKEG